MIIHSMYDYVCKIENKFIQTVFYKTYEKLINLVYPRFVKLTYGIDAQSDVIISLTSFPDRIDTVWITIATLLKQTVKPKQIILWLSQNQFPHGINDLPQNLIRLCEYGLTIKFCDNLYPHKKYYYSILENPEARIITVDDDILYPECLVEDLLEASKKHPGIVCCTWAHKMVINDNGEISPYSQWEHCYVGEKKPSFVIMPVGCGGVLYPPHCLHEDVFDKEKIEKLCIRTDDLWLKCMAVRKGTKSIRIYSSNRMFFSVSKTQSVALHHENVGENKNDIAMKNILEQYPEFCECLRIDNERSK